MPTMRPGWVRSASATALAMPKSATFTRPSPQRRTLAGFTSRCTSPARWAASSASATCAASPAACHGSIGVGVVEAIAQRAALDQLHHDRLDPVVGAGVVDRDDAGVGQAGGGHGLLAEPGHEGGVGGEVRVQHLHRHAAAQDLVGALPHLGHAAGRDERPEAVAALQQPPRLHAAGVVGVARQRGAGGEGRASSRTLEPTWAARGVARHGRVG